jgi:CheY-like chemotaxis protein
MPVVSILNTPFCNGRKIAEKLAEEQNLNIIRDEVINRVSVDYDVPINKLMEAINGSTSLFAMSSKERRKYIFFIKEAVAREVSQNNCVFIGYASHLIPRDISHVLKVCLTGDIKYRMDNAIKQKGISGKEAEKLIKELDKNLYNWTDFIYKTNPWDANLYDIVIPAHQKTIEEMISMISINMAKDVLEESQISKQRMDNFVLASHINAVLARKNHDVDVVAKNGNVTILLRKYYLRLEHYKNELKEIVNDIESVKSVTVKMGPSFNMPFMHIPVDFDAPNKTLLVDDEKEFVETLSERLKSRNISSTVAHTGQAALDTIEKEKPEVMVLDLKMPGMGGMDVLRQVKEKYPQIEVIILTGHGSEKEEDLAMELGAFAYLEKPVDIKVLSKTMKDAYSRIKTSGGQEEE